MGFRVPCRRTDCLTDLPTHPDANATPIDDAAGNTAAPVRSCTASNGWSGTTATSGSESVGPITQDTTYTLNCTGASGNAVAMTTLSLREAVLSWQAPRTNVDGSALTNLSGDKIYYRTTSNNYTETVSIPGTS